ncbi:MAG: DUF1573 domain-containing protein [Bacteroidetes bacterium]|nr:DUF1573 domain-containing protein [Bacteroidota bacterium]
MKKILIMAVMALGSMAVNAQTNDAAATPATATVDNSNNPNAPDIVFMEETHDFGTLPYSGNGETDFKFTNKGKEPLIISNARGSCGCTVPEWPKEPIMPGQSAAIHVKYDTKRVGQFTKTITVTSNAKASTKVITIKGNVMSQEETENQSPVKKANPMAPTENK